MDGNNQLRPFLIHRAHGKLGLQGRSTEHMESWVCGAFAVSDDVDWLLLHVFVDGEAPCVKSGRPQWVTSGFQLRVCFLMGIAGTVCDHQKLPLLQCFFDHGQRRMVWKPKEYKMHAVGRDYTEGKGDREIDRHFCIPVATPRYTQKLEKWPRKNYIWHRWNVVQWCIYCCVATCIYNDLHTYIHAYIHTYVHTYIHTYIPTYLHTYIPTYLHTHIRTYLHTYIHTYIPTYLHSY